MQLREARVRPLTGADEAFLAETGRLSPAERSSAILARCVTVAGSEDPLEAVRRLSIGDREALLLHIHRLTFGDAFTGVVECGDPACGAAMDVAIAIPQLLLPPYPDPQEWHDLSIAVGQALQFRLPNGADQEDAAALALSDLDAAADALLGRCVRTSDPLAGLPSPLPVAALAEAMVAADPQAEISLDLVCPVCSRSMTAWLDAGSVLYREVAGRLSQLYREVHTLALSYHWSETEILSLTPPQRLRYLDLLAESAAGAAV
jgi:hypothetical protein